MLALSDLLPFSGLPKRASDTRPRLVRFLGAPFTFGFLLVAWGIFLPLVRGNGWISEALRQHIGFIPALWMTDPARAFIAAHVGIIVQHSWGQIIYISLLLLLVGRAYERREGPLRALLIFYGACLVGVLALTTVVLTTSINGPHHWAAKVANTSWSGASVGAFGLLGGTIGTSRRPWALLAAWVLFEVFVEWAMVPGLAVSMHIAGFTFGFVASRYILAHEPQRLPGPLVDASPTPAEDPGARDS